MSAVIIHGATQQEIADIKYALREMANRRAEQCLDRGDAQIGLEAVRLRGLSDRINEEVSL